MSIAVVCSKCSAKLNAPDGAAGKKVKCPKCQAALVIPEAVASQFEVVEDESPAVKRPVGKPARVKAAVDDDDDDRPRRKRSSEEADEDDDDRPRKKKRRKGGDEEGGVSMTRNIVMGVVLIVLLAVAAYIFYDRSQNQKEADQQERSSNSLNSDPTLPDHPSRNMQLPKGDGVPTGGGGEKFEPATFVSPKGYSITFPGPFRTDEELAKNLAGKLGFPAEVFKCDYGTSRTQYSAIILDFDSSSTADSRRRVLEGVTTTLLRLDEGESASQQTVTWIGRQCKQLVFQERRGGRLFTEVIRLLPTEARLYALGATKESEIALPSAVLETLFDSFVLTLPGWTPDPKIIGGLTQKGELAGFQFSLPQRYLFLPNLVPLPPHLKMSAWAVRDSQGIAKPTLSIMVMSGTENVEAAGKNIRQFLVNTSAGYTDALGIKIATRGLTESGFVNGQEFSRFAFTALGSNQADIQGLVCGAIDGDRVVVVIGIGFGDVASAEIKVLESIIATLKKTG